MGTSSACDSSGEADEEPALRSRSSKRLFSFLPVSKSVPTPVDRVYDRQQDGTHGSFVGRCGSVSAASPRDLISLSNPHRDLHSNSLHCLSRARTNTVGRWGLQMDTTNCLVDASS